MTLNERLDIYEKLMRLDKPVGALLLLWPTLWGLWLAWHGRPNIAVLVIFVLGVVLMRSAGCVVNDFADRHFDAHVERTRNRPLAAKMIAPREALALAAVLMLLALGLVLQLNEITIKLAAVALVLAVVYPFVKRYFWLPQAWLGIAFGFGIPMAFAARYGAVPLLAWGMVIANMFWVVAYDTEYAMVDRDDDIKLGIKSSAILFGRYDVAGVIACHALFLAIMAWLGWRVHLGVFYALGWLISVLLVYYQYLLIRGRERARCLKAFVSNNWIGLALFGGMALDFLLRVPSFRH